MNWNIKSIIPGFISDKRIQFSIVLIVMLGFEFFTSAQGLVPELTPWKTDSKWHSSNPGGGGAFGVVGAGPTGIIIVGSDLGGAYRSFNRGKSWDVIGSFRGLDDTHICGLGFDPIDPSLIFIGAEHGLYRSADTGNSVNKVIDTGYITDIQIAPSNTNVGFAAFHSKYNTTDGQVYKSTDKGLTWSKSSVNLPSGLHILKILVSPVNENDLYLLSGRTAYASGDKYAFRSKDGGIHWDRIGNSLGDIKDIVIDKFNSSAIYLSAYPGIMDDMGYLYRSDDQGENWEQITHRTGFIFLDPSNPKFIRLIEIGYQYPDGSRSGVWASIDSGLNWFRYSDIGPDWEKGWSKNFHYSKSFNGDVKTFGRDMSDPNAIYWITSGWVFGSFDKGLTFKNLYTDEITPGSWRSRGINNAVLFDIEISNANPDIIYLGYFDLGLFRSMNQGISWENLNHPVYTGAWKADGGSSYTIATDPTRENVVWAAMGQDRQSNKLLLRSSDYGNVESWEKVGTGLPVTPSLFGLTVDPYSPESNRKLFITAGRNVYMSVDDGYNWSLSLDSESKCHFIALDNFDSNIIYAGGAGGVWRSDQGGMPGTWKPIGLPAMKGSVNGDLWDYGWQGVMDIKTDPLNPNWLYVAAFGTLKGLYRSKDKGENWEKILTDNFLRSVAISPANADLIYAASSKPLNSGGYDINSNGVKKSIDGGITWEFVNEGLPYPFATTLEINPGNSDLVMIASPGEGCNIRNFHENGPVLTFLKPHGTLPAETSSAEISLLTEKAATCKYSQVPNTSFANMTDFFTTTGEVNHSSLLSDLEEGTSYTYYCRCKDESGNVNTEDYAISFKIANKPNSLGPKLPKDIYNLEVIPAISGEVKFSVSLPVPEAFTLKIFDISGRLLWNYEQSNNLPGVYDIVWNGSNARMNNMYFVTLTSNDNKIRISRLFMK